MPTGFTIRGHRRFPVKCAVDYMSSDCVGKGIVRNLSRSGWRIEGDHTVAPGAILTLAVWLPGDSIPVKVEQAIVRWVSGRAFGIKILVMEPAEGMKLERLVARLLSPQTLGMADLSSDLPHGNPVTG
jgi:hypothetical protein